MTRGHILWRLLPLLALLGALALPAAAQECDGCIWGVTTIDYDSGTNSIVATASTEMDDVASAYYTADVWLDLDDCGAGGLCTYSEIASYTEASYATLEDDGVPGADEFEGRGDSPATVEPYFAGFNFEGACSFWCDDYCGCFWQGFSGNGVCGTGFVGGSCGSMYLPDYIEGYEETVDEATPGLCSGGQDYTASAPDLNTLYNEYGSSTDTVWPNPACGNFISSNDDPFNGDAYGPGGDFTSGNGAYSKGDITDWGLFKYDLQSTILYTNVDNSPPAGDTDADIPAVPLLISSLYRTPYYTTTVGGTVGDGHNMGTAVDYATDDTENGYVATADYIAWVTAVQISEPGAPGRLRTAGRTGP